MRRTLQFLSALSRIAQARLHDKYTWQDQIAEQCERLGGVYIKFIQMLASHETTKHWVSGISTDMAYEQVPYEPIDIAKELGDKMHNFAEIEDVPFAAGSYGQVYHAKLLTGEDVIVKILRPSVRKTLRQDLRIINRITRVMSWMTKGMVFDVHDMTDEFSRTTIAETDYKREAESGEWLRSYFDQRGTLVIPRSYKELGSRYVLVQDYVPGISLASAMSQQRQGKPIDQVVYEATGSNVWEQLTTLGKEALNAVLYADFQMVDPHPGNIRLLANNKVAMIDFGMMGKAPRNRSAFMNMVGEFIKIYEDRFEPGSFAASMLAFYDMELHDALQVIARQSSGDYVQSLETFVRQFVQSQAGDGLTQHYILDRQMARMFNEVINNGNKLGICVSKENVMLVRSMNMFLSTMRMIGEAHGERVHFTLLHNMMVEAYQEALEKGFEQRPVPAMSDERAYEVTANWLTVIAEKDRELYGYIMRRRLA